MSHDERKVAGEQGGGEIELPLHFKEREQNLEKQVCKEGEKIGNKTVMLKGV